MSDSANPRTAIWIGAAALVAVGALLFVVVREANQPPPAPPPTGSEPPSILGPDQRPAPQGLTTVKAVWDHAWSEARSWRGDARITRFYVDGATSTGGLQEGATAQLVFLSRELTERGAVEGIANGLRFSLERGKVSATPIKQYPAPPLTGPEPQLCDIPALAKGAPSEFVLDADYVPRGAQPALSLFTRTKTWMVKADPFTCEPRERGVERTDQELDAGPELPFDVGGVFDLAKAGHLMDEAARQFGACKKPDGPTGPGSVAVTFKNDGKVGEVKFERGPYEGTPVGDCIAARLRKLEVRPWQIGRGYVSRPFEVR